MRLALTAGFLLLLLLHAAPAFADPWGDARKAFRSAQKDPSWKERRAAYLTMLDFDGEKAFAEVFAAVLREKNAAVILEGLKTLGSFETPEALAVLDAGLARPKGKKGAYLVLALANQKGAHGVEKLAQLLAGKDGRIATLAAYALGRKAVQPALEPLIAALGHKDWHAAAEAARAIQRIAWSTMTKPDKRKGELPKPAMPEWFDPKAVLWPLIDALEKASGPPRGAFIEALASITKKDFGDNHAAWVLHADGKEPDAALLRKRVYAPHFFGIPVYGKRIAVVMDISVLTDNEHPFKERKRLQELCAVPGGRDVPWFKLRSIWQFNAAHVKRFIKDLPTRGVKFEVVLSGLKARPMFGKLVGANAGNKNAAIENIDKASLEVQNDILTSMHTALDLSGSKDSAAWTKGPDVLVCIYSSVPWEAEETDPVVIGATIGLKARLRGIQVHAVGVHEYAYEMMKLFAYTSGGRYLELAR